MKTAFSLLAALVGLTSADTTNVTIASAARGAHEDVDCSPVSGPDPRAWYYNTRAEGPYDCTTNHDTSIWSMLDAYRSGGTQGVHWKYTDNVNDSECLINWKYYSSDGQTLIAKISGRTTTQNDPRRWCALPVYRSGGVKGKQWDYCYCTVDTIKPDALGGH